MKKIIFSIIGIAAFTLFSGGAIFAQESHTARAALTDEGEPRFNHTKREEAEGKIVWEKLQAKQVQCSDLSDDNFGTLGEYFMGQMFTPSKVEGMGDSHEAMNNMMIQMMGEKAEEQMHVVMGKRLSGCDTSAAIPSQGIGFMPMMQMMMGGNNSMMNFGFGPFGGFGWIFMILWWVLIIAGIVALVRWLSGQFQGGASRKSALNILKERYAKGEIDKKEFEDKSREINLL